MIILYFCSRSAQHQWCCIITTYSLFVSRGRCDVAMQMTGAGYQIWGVVAVRSSDTDTTNSLINRVRGVEEVVKHHQSHQRSFNGQSGARCPHYLEMISPPPRPSVIREYKTMCRGPVCQPWNTSSHLTGFIEISRTFMGPWQYVEIIVIIYSIQSVHISCIRAQGSL